MTVGPCVQQEPSAAVRRGLSALSETRHRFAVRPYRDWRTGAVSGRSSSSSSGRRRARPAPPSCRFVFAARCACAKQRTSHEAEAEDRGARRSGGSGVVRTVRSRVRRRRRQEPISRASSIQAVIGPSKRRVLLAERTLPGSRGASPLLCWCGYERECFSFSVLLLAIRKEPSFFGGSRGRKHARSGCGVCDCAAAAAGLVVGPERADRSRPSGEQAAHPPGHRTPRRRVHVFRAHRAGAASPPLLAIHALPINWELPDNPTISWNVQLVTDLILRHVKEHRIDLMLSFDQWGVSGHANHVAIYQAFRYIYVHKLTPPGCRMLCLHSVTLLRKYSSLLELPLALLQPHMLLCLARCSQYRQALRAMMCHRSQMLWFRWLYLLFSRYMFVNTFWDVSKIELELCGAIPDSR